jgi:hypothetical protein
MAERPFKNALWKLLVFGDGSVSNSDAHLAVLMDIRDELQSINRKLDCHRIPKALDAIGRIDRRLQNSGVLVEGRRRK